MVALAPRVGTPNAYLGSAPGPPAKQPRWGISMLIRLVFVSLLLLSVTFAASADAAPIPIAVTISTSPLAYVFNGGAPDAPLGLLRGQTYIFQLSPADAANHPFFISTTTGVEPPTAFVDPGLTGNGTATVMFTVPAAPTVPLFYQCSVHSFMTNTITLTAPKVPALGTGAAAVLGGLVLIIGVASLRRRARQHSLMGESHVV